MRSRKWMDDEEGFTTGEWAEPLSSLVRALLLLWAAAYILLHRPGRPDTTPSHWLAPTPIHKCAALGGLLCFLPCSRMPRVSCSDSNQHCHTTELFILYAAAGVKRNNLYSPCLARSLPFPLGCELAWFVIDGSISGSWHYFYQHHVSPCSVIFLRLSNWRDTTLP